MERQTIRRILGTCLLFTLMGCHAVNSHRRPPASEQADRDYGMTALPVTGSFTDRLVPNAFLDFVYQVAQSAQAADR